MRPEEIKQRWLIATSVTNGRMSGLLTNPFETVYACAYKHGKMSTVEKPINAWSWSNNAVFLFGIFGEEKVQDIVI
jgi:hypothetical protein